MPSTIIGIVEYIISYFFLIKYLLLLLCGIKTLLKITRILSFRLLNLSADLTTNLFYRILFLFLLWEKTHSMYSVLDDKQFSLVLQSLLEADHCAMMIPVFF